jgi:F-type H+-transporting ATPase subunit b
MIDINISLVYQLVNFLFLLWILNVILYRPIRKVLRERNERLGGLEAEIKGLLEEVEIKAREMTASLNKARSEGYGRKEELKQQGVAAESEIIGEITEKTETEISKNRKEIAADIASAREILKKQVNDFSQTLAEKILGRKVA